MRWYVVSTKPYQEPSVALNLEGIGLKTFCPKIRQSKRIGSRDITVDAPLFPGYVFVQCNIDVQYRAVIYARGVRKLIAFGDVPASVGEDIIDAIKARLDNGYLLLSTRSFEKGQMVRVESGPLHGLEAVFERQMSDQQRAILLLKTLAYQARVVVPMHQVTNRPRISAV